MVGFNPFNSFSVAEAIDRSGELLAIGGALRLKSEDLQRLLNKVETGAR